MLVNGKDQTARIIINILIFAPVVLAALQQVAQTPYIAAASILLMTLKALVEYHMSLPTCYFCQTRKATRKYQVDRSRTAHICNHCQSCSAFSQQYQ